ncbi:MAG TPA: helix-turn-helix domain-containing protein [Pseudonocardiaceae bacterium]|jgi:DNA-binding transcriptional ArsR family regulator|nr:helix-turn-helix domain-containing protein [Pseudonocardiaceae bacterium]
MTDEQTPPRTTRRRPASRAEAAALSSAVRLRIIRLTVNRALTNKEIAQRLGKDPATTLYHVRKLVATGFLVAQPERSGARGSKEIPYLGTGLSWRLSGAAKDPDIVQAMLAAYLGEIADLEPGELKQTRLVVQLDDTAIGEFTDRLNKLLEEFAARPSMPDGRELGIYVAWYPSR